MSNAHNSARRTGFWSRLRENRPQTPGTTAAHRHKSRSPDASGRDERSTPAESSSLRKRKKQGAATNLHNASTLPPYHARSSRTPHDVEMTSDRGRKAKRRPQSGASEDTDMRVSQDVAQSSRRQARSKRKARSRSRDSAKAVQKAASLERLEEAGIDRREQSGPLDATEHAKMREELERLKQQVDHARKSIKQQSKVIDSLRRDLTIAEKSHDDKRKQVDKLKTQLTKTEEVLTCFEANLNCQICIDILLKPYGLSPCGHVLCLTCLQEWFRSAPPGDDEMYDDTTPDDLLYRKKTCPVCRTLVLFRPIPLFLVKSLAHALDKSKQLAGAPPRISPPPDPDSDPWAGIFLPDDSSDEEGEEGDGDRWSIDEDEDGNRSGDTELEDYGYDDAEDGWNFEGYGTPDDEEQYEGGYVPARWAPPTMFISPEDYAFEDLTDEQLCMLRRGATLQMIALFSMSYTHDEGLRAVVDGNELYLGYNIALNLEDSTGEEFMDWTVADVFERPERWEKEDTEDGFMAWRLVPSDEDEEYDTTDSEAYLNEEDEY